MKLNNTVRILSHKRWVLALLCFAVVGAMSLTANLSYAALAKARVIRVTAADIAKLPARQNYIVDLRQSNVAYDLDGTERAIDWNRVRIRTAAGDVTLTAYLREHSPTGAKGTSTRLVIGAQGGIQKALGLKAAPNPGTEYKCGEICSCSGGADCETMLAAKVCKSTTSVCGTEEGKMWCDCEAK